MAEFDYKQRPFTKQLTDEQYDRAVGRTHTYDRNIVRKLERELEDEAQKTNIFVGHRIKNDAGFKFDEAPCECPKPCGYRHWKRADAVFPHSADYRNCARCGGSFSPITSGADNRYKFCSCACEDAE